MNERWNLVRMALIGTDRAGFPPPAELPDEFRPLLTRLDALAPEESLLLVAGILNQYQTAGRLPDRAGVTDWHLPAFRPEGDLAPCPLPAARLLEQMLNQRQTEFLPEFLSLLGDAGYRCPDALLPPILEYGQKVPRSRPLIWPVIGERGRWLAALNPAWAYAAIEVGEWGSLRRAWEIDPKGRAVLVAYLRDREPKTARELVEISWRTEADAARRELLRALEKGLSLADEPFLERALDDRDSQVRRLAVDLLAGLPESRLVTRMTAAAGHWLEWRQSELIPHIPPTLTDSLVRDGVIRPQTSQPTATERSRLLIQSIGVIPPRHWEARFDREPEALVAAAVAGKWPRTLLSAFAAATIHARDRRWAEALLTVDGFSERTGLVLALLPPETCHAFLHLRLAADDDAAVVVFLRRWPHEWDETGGRALLDFFGEQSTRVPETRLAPTLRYLSRQFANQCPPSLAGYAEDLFSRLARENRITNAAWKANLNSLATRLSFRRSLLAAVAGETDEIRTIQTSSE